MTADEHLGGQAEEFCRRLHPRLLRALYLQFADPSVAEDVAQEALARAWERWPTVSSLESPEAWVFRVAFNLRSSIWRRRMTENRFLSRTPDSLAVPATDVSDVLDVRAAVLNLPDRERAAIVLRYFLDLSVERAAEVLGCQPGTVKSLTFKAIVKLRRRLAVDLGAGEESLHA